MKEFSAQKLEALNLLSELLTCGKILDKG